jgi:AcrR family transcriptional regulator
MSSLTYNGVAARSGVATTTLKRYWTGRVDAVTDAVGELFAQNPVPETGDLHGDLVTYLTTVAEMLSSPRGREVIGALVTEAASNEVLMETFRKRVAGSRRADLVGRLERQPGRIAGDASAAVDQLLGPLYHRSLIAGLPLDEAFIEAVVASVVAAAPAGLD